MRETSADLATPVEMRIDSTGGAVGEFRLKAGEERTFILQVVAPGAKPTQCPTPMGAAVLFQRTVDYWQRWLKKGTYTGRWRDQVYRSALALKLMTYEPTGASVAAPTTSLPEGIGGVRNWDYRYTWIRDTAFTPRREHQTRKTMANTATPGFGIPRSPCMPC